MGTDKVKGHLDLMLLGVLAQSPGHGYAVITALRDRSDGEFDLPEGTVYPALHRLEDAGLVTSDWEDLSGRRRRVYRLTTAGVGALAVEKQRWARFVSSLNVVLHPAELRLA